MNTALPTKTRIYLILCQLLPYSLRKQLGIQELSNELYLLDDHSVRINTPYDACEIHNQELSLIDAAGNVTALGLEMKSLLEYAALPFDLYLPDQYIYRQDFTFPPTHKKNLPFLIKNQIELSTPFIRDTVVYAYSARSVTAKKNDSTKVYLCTQSALNQCKQLADQLDVSIRRIIPLDSNGNSPEHTDLHLSNSSDDPEVNIGGFQNRWLFFALLLALAIFSYSPVFSQWRYSHTLQEKIDILKKESQSILAKKNIEKQRLDNKHFIANKAKTHHDTIDLLHQLTEKLPNTTWINRYERHDDRVTLHGESKNAAKLIEILESTKLFSSPTFSAPIVKNETNKSDRFVITASLKDRSQR